MRSNNGIFIILGIIFLCLLAFFVFFEYVEVPDVNWNQNYNLDSMEPYGAGVFAELLELYYQDVPVEEFKGDIPTKNGADKALYVMIGARAEFPDRESYTLDSLAEKGHTVMLIASKIKTSHPAAFTTSDQTNTLREDSLSVRFVGKDKPEFTYKHYTEDFKSTSKAPFKFFDSELEHSWYFDELAEVDGRTVFAKTDYVPGGWYVHSLPELFSNSAALQPGFLDNFNSTFEGITVDRVYYADADRRKEGPANLDNPMQYVLQQRGLKWAYYMTLLTGLLFVLFGGKRRQQVIPTRKVNENTSLEYVKTLSRLFQKQNQNQKLVTKMEKVFYHRISREYFIDKNDAEFTSRLSRKTLIPEEQIDDIRNRLSVAAKMGSYSDGLLMETYNKLDSFYKKAK